VLLLHHHVWVVSCRLVRWMGVGCDLSCNKSYVSRFEGVHLEDIFVWCWCTLLDLMLVTRARWHDLNTEFLLVHLIFGFGIYLQSVFPIIMLNLRTLKLLKCQLGKTRRICSSFRILCIHGVLMHFSGLFEKVDLNYM
jgi:hypothetical protein